MDLRLIGIIVVALCVISLVYTEVQKRLIFSRYEKLFERGDFEGCLRVLDGPVARVVYPRYNQLYMRLNAQMCLSDAEAARATIDEMLALGSSDKQRLVLLLRAFNFFVEQEDYDRAGELLGELREKASPEQLAGCERTYAIFAEKSSAYIDRWRPSSRTPRGRSGPRCSTCSPCSTRTRGTPSARTRTSSRCATSSRRALPTHRPSRRLAPAPPEEGAFRFATMRSEA